MVISSGSFKYFVHYIRRLQDNNYDCLTLVSGDKGSGKSSSAISLAREYIDDFGFICPNCGHEFFKNIYSYKMTEAGTPDFYIPDYVKDDTAWIKCPEEYELDLKTGVKSKVAGCGFKFKYSQRKKIKWSASKFIAYDNKDIVDKIFSSSRFSPVIADEAIRFAGSQEHNKTESRELKKLFTVIRPKGFWFFFNIPDVLSIDSKYREIMSSFWIRMIERGTGLVFEKNKGESDDHYEIDQIKKTLGVIKYFTPMEKIKRQIVKHPCYFDTFKFRELPADVYDDYELVRNAVNLKREVENRDFNQKDFAKIVSYNLIHNWDHIQIMINKARENRMTYKIMSDNVFADPISRSNLVSDVTLRSWVYGVEKYVTSKGSQINVFDGLVSKPEVENLIKDEIAL